MPKDTSKAETIKQVQRALELRQPLDEERLSEIDTATANSYVSFDTISVQSEINWIGINEPLLEAVRNKIPQIDAPYIDSIFGPAKNGI